MNTRLRPIHDALTRIAQSSADPLREAIVDGLSRHEAAMDLLEPKRLAKLGLAGGAAALVTTSGAAAAMASPSTPNLGNSQARTEQLAVPAKYAPALLAGHPVLRAPAIGEPSTAPRLWDGPSTDPLYPDTHLAYRMTEAQVHDLRAMIAEQPSSIAEAKSLLLRDPTVLAEVLGPMLETNGPGFTLTSFDAGDGGGPRIYAGFKMLDSGGVEVRTLSGETHRFEPDPEFKNVHSSARLAGKAEVHAFFMDEAQAAAGRTVHAHFSQEMLKQFPSSNLASGGAVPSGELINRLQKSADPTVVQIREDARLDPFNTGVNVYYHGINGRAYAGLGLDVPLKGNEQHLYSQKLTDLPTGYAVLSSLDPSGKPTFAVVSMASFAYEQASSDGALYPRAGQMFMHFSDGSTNPAVDAKTQMQHLLDTPDAQASYNAQVLAAKPG